MIATVPSTIDINGTLGWTAKDVTATTVSLNVTRDLTISSGDTGTLLAHSSGSFSESINLATRIVSLLSVLMPEIDQALQMATTSMRNSLPTGVNWSGSMSTLDNTIVNRPLYTMWWVNGPLKLNQTIPVLVLPTNVTRTSNVALGGTLGTRTAWTLTFSLSRPLISPDPTAISPSGIPFGNELEVAFIFNYDQTSDLLLSASATVHMGFGQETTIQQSPCVTSTSPTCPATSSPMTMMGQFGVNIQVSLKLTGTTIDLNQRMTTISSHDGNSGSQSGTGSSSGTGTLSGSDTGSGTNLVTGTGSGSTSGTGGTSIGTGQPASNPGQPKSSLGSAGSVPWIYALLGIIVAVVIGSGTWIAGKRTKRAPPNTFKIQPSI
jgi:hypothetical protein